MCHRLDLRHRPRPARWALLLPAWLAACAPDARGPVSADGGPRLLAASPDPIALGSLRPGQGAEGTLGLRNPGDEAVEVASVETSCPCIRASPPALSIAPRGAGSLTLAFDPSDEPGFRGMLSVEVTGWTADRRVAFRTRAELEVAPGSPPAAGTPGEGISAGAPDPADSSAPGTRGG
jgi:hypothetical protein